MNYELIDFIHLIKECYKISEKDYQKLMVLIDENLESVRYEESGDFN